MFKGKKGSHVGLVLSFVVFVTFVIFLFTALEPTFRTNRNQQIFLDSLQKSLIEQFSDDLTTQTISIDDDYSPGDSCISIPVVPGTENMDVIVKDENNNVVVSEKSGAIVKIEFSGEDFFRLLYSNTSFEPSVSTLGSCSPISEESGDYSIGFTRTKEYIFQRKIIDFIGYYEEDYNGVKDLLNVPIGSEFEFSFINSSGGISGTSQENVSTEVYAEEIPVQYMNSTGDISSGFLNVRVWG